MLWVTLPVALSAALLSPAAHGAPSCTARSGPVAPPIVELYTSEGCSSCPPAGKWLSRLKSDPSVVALAFHVDYWDRLGWKDRFASAAHTQRQAEQQRSSGARFVYTPQVILNGVDRPDWPRAGTAPTTAQPTSVEAQLTRNGESFTATITSATTMRLAAYWAVTEHGHRSAVKAGENLGATLTHDHVVREYRPVAAWAPNPAGAPTVLNFRPAVAAEPAHPREINLVLVDATSGRPVQALKLGC